MPDGCVLSCLIGDITKLNVDVIVNAANSSLRGGSGVDGAIHRAAGPELVLECMKLGGCRTGEAKLTMAYRLPAKFVIHTVGPVWQGGQANESQLLAECYSNAMEIALTKGCNSIAFPCISTGIYGFPPGMAAQIAVESVTKFPVKEEMDVIFCSFTESDLLIYKDILERLKTS